MQHEHTLSTPNISRQRQTIASVLQAQSFAQIPWQALLRDGAIVELHIRHCRFTTRLSLEDLGVLIQDGEVRQKLATWLVLGEKRLLPLPLMQRLNRIESAARYMLKVHSFQTNLGAFVPVTAYEAWRSQAEQIRQDYFALRDEILATYREWVNEVIADYEIIASDTYARLRQTHPQGLGSQDQTTFVATYCNRLAAQIPSPERIRDTFSFTWYRRSGLSQFMREPSFQEGETISPQTDERERQRAVLAQDLHQDALVQREAALDSFLAALVGQLRTLMYDACCDVLSTMQQRERFSARSTIQLRNLLAQVQSLNFFGDTELDQMMQRIEGIVTMEPNERHRSMSEIHRTLRAIATTTRATLLDLEEEPRLARALGIADVPTPGIVRQARAELGLRIDDSLLESFPAQIRAARAELTSLWENPVPEPFHRGLRAV